jgi:D-aspartate ligase
VAFDYTPSKYHEEMKALIREGKETNPLFYGPDKASKRLFRLWKNQLGHFVKFKQYYHKPD